MNRFVPLKSNNTDSPVMHIDSHAPLDFLFASADRRIRMARYLLETLDGADECDVRCIANAALMLLSDGCDALTVVEKQVFNPRSSPCTSVRH